MLGQTVAEVLSTLPPKVAVVFQQCLEGRLQSSDNLRRELEQFQARMREEHERSELLDMETADKLVETCQRMLDSMSDSPAEEDHRLIQAAVKYLIREDDEEGDVESPIGFDDDALVVRAIAKAIKLEESDEA